MDLMRFSHKDQTLEYQGRVFKATCTVRNELNGWRKSNQIVKSMPLNESGEPYMPRPFPTGVWKVGRPVPTGDPEFAPVKIPTDAFTRVLLWETHNGEYTQRSGETHVDHYYHLHFSEDSNTTLGCIRLNSAEDAEEIASLVLYSLTTDSVYLEVVL